MAEVKFEVSEERKKILINKIAQKVIDYRLAPLAIIFLESSKPLTFLGNQFLYYLQALF